MGEKSTVREPQVLNGNNSNRSIEKSIPTNYSTPRSKTPFVSKRPYTSLNGDRRQE
jgi:hypothetical protein